MQANSCEGTLNIKGNHDDGNSENTAGSSEGNFEGDAGEEREDNGADCNPPHEDRKSSGTESDSGADYKEDASFGSGCGDDDGACSDFSQAVQSHALSCKIGKSMAKAEAHAYMLVVRF